MFHDIYTYKNNHPSALFKFTDPLNLRNCIRVYSHENNSDCFFIAVIHKKNDFRNENHIKSNPYNLSMGERQRIALASILATNKEFLLLDEVTSMVDYNGKQEIYKIIDEYQQSQE